MKIIRYNVGPMDNNTYLVVDEASGAAAVIDPSFESRGVWDELVTGGWKLRWVLNTHAHLDHVVENAFFTSKSAAPLALHADDAPLLQMLPEQAAWMGIQCPVLSTPDRILKDVDTVTIGGGVLNVVHTPGHSPGSVSFLGDGFAIVGDTLFAGSIGRTDLPGGSSLQLLSSIRTQLLSLPDATVVYPGHGAETTIRRERRTNPYLAVK